MGIYSDTGGTWAAITRIPGVAVCVELTEGLLQSIVPCGASKEWNKSGRVDLAWIEVGIVVYSCVHAGKI